MTTLTVRTFAALVASSLLAACGGETDPATETKAEPVAEALHQPARQDDMVATARRGIPIDQEGVPDAIAAVAATDRKTSRNYPMQPPLIPHDIRGYEVNLNSNTCMSCHSRRQISDTQATMISVTHYMDRQGNFLAEISPRRYFCQQCHVVQTATTELVNNDFEDMDNLISEIASDEAAQGQEN